MKITLIFGNSQEFPGSFPMTIFFPIKIFRRQVTLNKNFFMSYEKTYFFWTHLFKCKKYNEAFIWNIRSQQLPPNPKRLLPQLQQITKSAITWKTHVSDSFFSIFNEDSFNFFFASLLPSLSYFFSSFHTHLFSFSLIRHFEPEC